MSFTLRAKRLLVGAASGAMVLSLLPAGIAAADTEAVCANAPDAEFSDVNDGGTHTDNINCMTAYGIGIGLSDGSYGVFSNLTRGQAATLLVNFAVTATDGAIADSIDESMTVPFTDIDGTTHETNIEVLYQLGLIQGTTATTYSPNLPITRVQFATILFNAHEALGIDFDDEYADPFVDTDRFEALALAGEGIVSGTTPVTFEPFANVLRGQTATLLAESAGVLDDAGLWDADRLPVPVEANQDFAVTPGDEATLAVSTSSTDNTGARTFTASGLGSAAVNIALFPAGNVSTDADGVVTFAATGTAPNEVATGIGTGAAVIEVVQGVATGGQHIGDDEAAIMPTNGSITFTIDSQTFAEIVPVVFVDADNDNQLDVDSDGAPEEAFGIGGATTWIAAEAADGDDLVAAVVQFVDKDADFFVAGGSRFDYSSGDSYTYDVNSVITFAQWEAALSVGDDVTTTDYSRTFQNDYLLSEDVPGTATALAAAVGDFDATPAETDADDVRFTWNAPNPADGLIASYSVTVYDDNPDTAGCQTGTVVDTETSTSTTVDVEELANDTYCATVSATSQSGETGSASAPVFFTVQVGTADVVAPTIESVALTTDGATTGVIGAGDVITFGFSEAMATATATSGVFRFTDPQGEVFQLSCADAATTCALIATDLNDDGDTTDAGEADSGMTVTLTAAPTKVGGNAGDSLAQVPGTITEVSTHWDDVAGNQLNVAGSADLVIDIPLG